jgi:SAM-dependent methyltransferase
VNSDEEKAFDHRARTRELAAEFAEKGDVVGWFDALYKESGGDSSLIPWADMEPNRFLRAWAESVGLKGNGRHALVVGCGLGDDARYLQELGFKVTGFDISPTAIDWAKRLHADTDIEFFVADLFETPPEWKAVSNGNVNDGGFAFVLEVYTIQPLPIAMRPRVIDAIASFVKPGGELVVVTQGRGDDDEPDVLPWPVSRRDLKRFDENGLQEQGFVEMAGDEGEPPRFVVTYIRSEVCDAI